MPSELGGEEVQLLPAGASLENNCLSFTTPQAVVTEAGTAFGMNSL